MHEYFSGEKFLPIACFATAISLREPDEIKSSFYFIPSLK